MSNRRRMHREYTHVDYVDFFPYIQIYNTLLLLFFFKLKKKEENRHNRHKSIESTKKVQKSNMKSSME